MSHSSIDRSFLLVTLAFEKGLIDQQTLIDAIGNWLHQDFGLVLTPQVSLSEAVLQELRNQTTELIQTHNSVEICFGLIQESCREVIRNILPNNPALIRFRELLSPLAVQTPIDRSFLLATLAFEKGLIDQQTLMDAVWDWIDNQDKGLMLPLDGCLSLDALQTLQQETSQLVATHGTIEACFAFIQTSRREIIHRILPDDPALQRFRDLLGIRDTAPPKKADDEISDMTSKNSQFSNTNSAAQLKALLEKEEIAEFKAGRFFAMEKIDGDGMGDIYFGYDKELMREVAIKTTQLQDDYRKQQDYDWRLRREGKIQGQLEHPKILPIYGTGITNKQRPFIAMQLLVETFTLKDAIFNFHRGLPLLQKPAKDLAEVQPVHLDFNALPIQSRTDFRNLLNRFIEICEAIEHVHSKNYMHRDLKPTNIMIGNHGETFVIDFGLASHIVPPEELNDPDLVEIPADLDQDPPAPAEAQPVRLDTLDKSDGAIVGTPPYKAPEQHDNKIGALDHRTDIFALGLILCEIMTGTRPFYSRLSDEVLRYPREEQSLALIEQMRQGLGDLRQKNATIPGPLAAICRKAVAFEKADRYQSAQELGKDVENWLANEQVQAYAAQERLREKTARWIRRRPARASAIFATVLMITLSTLLFGIYSNQKNVELDETNTRLRNTVAERDNTNAQLEKKRFETLEESRKLAMNQGAWEEVLKVTEELDDLLDKSDLKFESKRLIDIKLDKLKAMDNSHASSKAQSLLENLLADYETRPDRFTRDQIGRLFVLKGDISLKPLNPDEKSPYLIASEFLQDESALMVYAKGMLEPNPEKAVELLDKASFLDPYAIRPLIVSNFIKFWLGRSKEAISTLQLRRAIMPKDVNLLVFEKMIDVISFNNNLSSVEDDKIQAYFKSENVEECYKIIFDLLPRWIRGENNRLIPFQIVQNAMSLSQKLPTEQNPGTFAFLYSFKNNIPACVADFPKFFPAFLGLNADMPEVSRMLSIARFLKLNLPEPLSANLAIQNLKDFSNRFPIQEISRILLISMLERNMLDEASELMDRFPEKSITLMPKDTFYSIIGTVSQHSSKLVAKRRTSLNPSNLNTPLISSQRFRESYRRLIPKLAKNVSFKDDSNLSTMLVEACELINDPELAQAILKEASTKDAFSTTLIQSQLEGLKAILYPERSIDYLINSKILGDQWASLLLKVHRDHPELVAKHPKLNEMPANPFMPTSIEFPLPLISEMLESFGTYSNRPNPLTPIIFLP